MFTSMILYVLSAILLALSFPKASWSFLAWIALVPLLLALDERKGRGVSFRTGYFCGFLFFAFTFYWLMFVTTLGAVLLVAYFALYFGLFGLGYSWALKKSFYFRLLFVPALWVSLEFLRAHVGGGFGWASLGYSQYQNLWLIQIADLTGVYGVSFLIVMANVVCKEVIAFFLKKTSSASRRELLGALAAFGILISASIGYGLFRLHEPVQGPAIRVGVAQGNVPNERRWSPRAWPLILRDYVALSQKLVREKVDLIVWPESAYPCVYEEDPQLSRALEDFFRKAKTPHLIGMVRKQNGSYFNAAALFSPTGEIVQEYPKIHLVLFGEFIPFRKQFPLLSRIVPIDDFTPGAEYTLFKASGNGPQNEKLLYAALVCFEDTVPELTRGFVNSGAQLLVNISNDAWFADTAEPWMHLQSAVFRSIENRRELVRCGNVGVSCFIDSRGRVMAGVRNKDGKSTYVEGVAAHQAIFLRARTLYTKCGDFFAYLCISGILMCVVLKMVSLFRKKGLREQEGP